MSNTNFLKKLRRFGIYGFSQKIPKDIGAHLNGLPPKELLIDIPPIESFPLPEPETRKQVDPSELKKCFVQAQLDKLRNNIQMNSNETVEKPKVRGLIIEIGQEFESREEFIKFRRCVATQYMHESQENEWKIPIQICADHICLNPAIPGFNFCNYHLPRDPHFDDQPFLKICSHVSADGKPCTTPCSSSMKKCQMHRSNRNRKGIADIDIIGNY